LNTRILILGIGSPQADAINYCQSRNYQVFACADSEHGLQMVKVDGFCKIDIKDSENVYRYALDNKVTLIFSVGSEVALPTIASVSKKLGLPYFADLPLINLCHHKDQLRSFLGSDFDGNVTFLATNNPADLNCWDIFPCVIKPVDSQGQRGFNVAHNRRELAECFERSLSHSAAGKVIIEEYIEGPELSVNLYLVEGRIAFSQITDRIVFDQYPGIVKAHRIPSRVIDRETGARINQLCEELVDKIALKNGPLYIQIKLKDRLPKLIEATPRLDGCHLWQLIEAFCGVNLLEAAFQHLLGHEVQLKPRASSKYFTLTFVTEKPGVRVKKAKYLDVIKNQGVQWYYDEEELVKPVNGCRERIAHFIHQS
jgi:phosphoribosylamine-glycine ligase